ncbi:glutathione S-transferase family protein [Undibacterium umbellatum]|uniref:Glutathione S-transferase family protein n=1 Tax=Undibacterium umbellatum TaxID=2762300 RepID=A0ABR6Z3G0_9BURK|nr:glutathione S-transferase family protein [Undibacterium umbellatum]MBC3906315.1 glutathione S-transferase family protein [Undibacterium umbellatum]
MSDLILHNFEISPFSEKIRLIFGFKQLNWKSVTVPIILPKPDVTALTGGYRRTPILQVGGDIYCDTSLIADVLEKRSPTRSLYPAAINGIARNLAQWADSTLFWTAIPYAFQPAAIPSIFGNISAEELQAFSADRATMRGNMPRTSMGEAKGQLCEYLMRLENMLSDDAPFLLGAQASIADFSVYQALWLVRLAPAISKVFDPHPKLLAWMDRLGAFGHHQSEALNSAEAIDIARNTKNFDIDGRNFIDSHGIALGEQVAIMPTDYALDPVMGELVIASENELALRREDVRAGTVVVHFPRVGFQMKRAK